MPMDLAPELLLPPTPGFKCAERLAVAENDDENAVAEEVVLSSLDDYDDQYDDVADEEATPLPVTFHVTVPYRNQATPIEFEFGSRRPSFDALTKNEECIEKGEFEESASDPNFFDKGYTLAGSTGFTVWAGARFMLDALVSSSASATTLTDNIHDTNTPNQSSSLHSWQTKMEQGLRVLELGGGVGLLGTGLAAAGAQVLTTDLPSLVDDAIRPNLKRNAKLLLDRQEQQQQDERQQNKETDPQSANENTTTPPQWLADASDTYTIGNGWAATTALDWSQPLTQQIGPAQLDAVQLIVASDCAWLASLLDLLLDTVAALFHATPQCHHFCMAFQRRDQNIGTALFTTVHHLEQKVQERNWTLRLLAWRPVTKVDGTETDVRLVEICPTAAAAST